MASRFLYAKTQYKDNEFNKIDDVSNLHFPGLTAQEASSLRKCGEFLVALKKRLSPENAKKLHGLNYMDNQSDNVSHSMCGVVNLDNKDISTDRHLILITKNLLSLFNEQELKAVLAHEVGHIVLNHVTLYKNSLREICLLSFQLVVTAAFSLLELIFAALFVRVDIKIELAKALMVLVVMLSINHYSKQEIRKDEFAADKKSFVYNKDISSLVSSLRKLENTQLSPQSSSSTSSGTTKQTQYDFLLASPTIEKKYMSVFMKVSAEYNGLFNKIIDPYKPYFATHPSTEEREQYLNGLEMTR